MVYRVCWRVLQHAEDAEDACQATFLVLARKLRTVTNRDSLASWLHGVAYRVALDAKARAATRRRHERRAAARPAGPPDEITWGELRTALDAELGRLPEKWRLPLVLCYLEGRTQEEAAGQLGWSKSTLLRRLGEARAALGRRLTRRGVVWSAALSAVLLSDCAAPAALPPGLLSSTVKAAGCIAAGRAASALVPAEVLVLVEGVHAPTSLALNKVAATLLALVLLAGGGGFAVYHATAEPARVQEHRAPRQPSGRSGEQGWPQPTPEVLAGRWLLTLPAGFQYQVVVRQLAEGRYSLDNAVRFSGIYERRANRLVLVVPRIRTEQGFEWEIRGAEELTLAAQPPAHKTGQDYSGAVLRRLPDKGAGPASADQPP
jgi:RNA polymerase sigma factor (sigma-70 family)